MIQGVAVNVYKLAAEIRSILSEAEEASGELTPELLARIDSLSSNTDDQINTIFRMVRHATICETALRGEVQYITTRARWWATTRDKLREHLMNLLKVLGVDSYETSICRPTICKGPPVVKVDEGFNTAALEGTKFAFLIEKEYRLLGDKIRQAARAGDELPEGVRVESGAPYLRL